MNCSGLCSEARNLLRGGVMRCFLSLAVLVLILAIAPAQPWSLPGQIPLPLAPARPWNLPGQIPFPMAPAQPWNLPGQIPFPMALPQPWSPLAPLQVKSKGYPGQTPSPLPLHRLDRSIILF